jgi:hypothetical protein
MDMRLFSKLFLSALIITGAFVNVPSYALTSGNGLEIGEKIPSFDLENDQGKVIKFDKEYKGKVLLLTLANYCNKDLAGVWTINSYYKFYKNKNFGFTYVFSRRCIPFYIPNAFVSYSARMTSSQVKIPFLLMDWDEAVFSKFKGSTEDPHVYVVDKNGIIKYKAILNTPFQSQDPMNKLISNLLNE